SVALKSFEEVVIEDDFIAFLTASGRCDNNPVLTCKLFQSRTARGRCGNDHDASDTERRQQLVVIVCRIVGTEDVELVLPVVAAAVSDQEEEESILRLELLLQRNKGLLNFRLSGLFIDQNGYSIGSETKLLDESLLRPGRPFRELRVVVRIASDSSENQGAG